MKLKYIAIALCVISVLIAGICLAVVEKPQDLPGWNVREPLIADIPFPTQSEANSKSIKATKDEIAEAYKWITDLLTPAALPPGFREHLMPLRDAIPQDALLQRGIKPELLQQNKELAVKLARMESGFLLKYKHAGYAFQIMETRSDVTVGILDLNIRLAKVSRADQLELINSTMKKFIKPVPADPFIIAEEGVRPEITAGWWSPVKHERSPKGNLVSTMTKSAFRDGHFWTDGKTLLFSARKNYEFPSEYMKPRFAALTPPVQQQRSVIVPQTPKPVTPYQNEKGEQLLHKELTPEELSHEVN